MGENKISVFIRITGALVALIFGGVTILVGFRTLFGFSDPGYTVFLPLLIFNSIMGFVYIGTGLLIWQSHKKAEVAVLTVFLLNFVVFSGVGLLHITAGSVALESILAMILRTAVWLVIYVSLRIINRNK